MQEPGLRGHRFMKKPVKISKLSLEALTKEVGNAMYIYVDLDPLDLSMPVFHENIYREHTEKFSDLFICPSAGFGAKHEWFAGNIDQVRRSSKKITKDNVS